MNLVELVHSDRAEYLQKIFLRMLRYYFRLEVEGIENIPKTGRAIICPNHSGYAGTDAILLAHLIRRRSGRLPRILAHRAFFDLSEEIKKVSESFGLKKASIQNGTDELNKGELLILFPEGEEGNFKSSFFSYRLQEFHTGFLRMALTSRSPIVPCVIIGAEESHINLGNIDLSVFIKGLRVPIPLNIIPLPAKWKIKFMPAIDLSEYPPEIAEDPEALKKLAKRVRVKMQLELRRELKKRPYIYTEKGREILDKVTSWLRPAQKHRATRRHRD